MAKSMYDLISKIGDIDNSGLGMIVEFMENNPKLITGINDNIKIVMASKFLFFINRKIIAGNNINRLSYLEIIKKKDER